MIRKFLLLALVALTASWAHGHYYGGFEWHISKRPPLVPQWHAVGSNEVFRRCWDGRQHMACSIFDLQAGVCNVWASQSEFDTPEWLRWHELLHCAGWDHD